MKKMATAATMLVTGASLIGLMFLSVPHATEQHLNRSDFMGGCRQTAEDQKCRAAWVRYVSDAKTGNSGHGFDDDMVITGYVIGKNP